MQNFTIFITGLASGLVIGLLLRRTSKPRPGNSAFDCATCDVITCQNDTGIPRVTIRPRALPVSQDAPTERLPVQFPRSLEKHLPEDLKSHTPEK